MKALSIQQPWAWLIIKGYKDIENRNYNTHLFPQRILIHASKKYDNIGHDFLATLTETNYINKPDYIYEQITEALEHFLNPIYLHSDCGALIGTVDLVDCVHESNSFWFGNIYGWVMKNPIEFPVPIPYKGQLGWWNVDLKKLSASYPFINELLDNFKPIAHIDIPEFKEENDETP
jgi:hypothetical protein